MFTDSVDRIMRSFADLLGPARCPWCERPAALPCAPCIAGLPWDRVAREASWSAFEFAEPVAEKIRALKFAADLGAARILGEAMVPALLARPVAPPSMIIPVPLHPSRLRSRGYNQALELARVLGRGLGLPVDSRAARRVRATEEQTHLGADARRRNLRGAFAVASTVTGRHVALLDDVITTGATIESLAAAVRDAGATRVEMWAVARTV